MVSLDVPETLGCQPLILRQKALGYMLARIGGGDGQENCPQ